MGMKNKTSRILLIIALLVIAAAVAFGVHYSGRDSGNKAEEPAADAVTEQTEEQPANEEEGPLATLFFASDYQAEPGFDAPADTLRGILKAAKADGKDINKVIMCGDYTNDAVMHDYQLSPDDSIEEIHGTVGSVFPEINADDMLFVQGNHDRMTDLIAPTGLYESDDYLIYILNTEDDFPWKQGKKAGCLDKVRKSSAAMKECFDKLIEDGETRPVFIAGHVPLHFTARTSSKHTTGDNLYSALIFDAVNDAARSLNIFYLYGHNHSKGWDCYMGGSSVYRAKGDSILIPLYNEYVVDTDEYAEETLNFTYLNAGYTGYYMNCAPAEYTNGGEGYHAADETLTGTVFEIYPDRIVVTRYDGKGVHVLGHAGEADPYKGGIDKDLIDEEAYSRETKSPQEIPRYGKL